MSIHPVENYLKNLSEIHRTGGGAKEESYYSALEALLNEAGAELKPRVRAVSQLRNTGAGEPDFGLFTANQFQSIRDERPVEGALPERGVVEAKGWAEDAFATAQSDQIEKYRKKYSLVLVTNYRDFALVGRDADGQSACLESFRLAESENAFLGLLAHPQKAAREKGEPLIEFLRRVLLYESALSNPEDLAWFLASYAREARRRVEAASGLPALESLKTALEEALGMKFEGEKGDHFFRATLVQTLFYGAFSSWVLWSRDHWGFSDTRFDWRNAAWTLHVPMVSSLFEQIATPQKLKPLGVAETLDWAGAALNRVDRAAFFARFEEQHAVQYFYEPFLKAYDPELRKELGVWFTPPEIVQYQVERVDQVLREELGIADGLADDKVVVLDPCCGTGAYLVETLRRIHKTMQEKGASALTASKIKRAAMERVFGFEILPAPFVVAHLQLGLMLRQLGAPLDHKSDQRAGIYLTNSLTGWEPPKEPKSQLPLFPELMQERDAANKVKQVAPILVVLGNPPYNAFAGTSPEEEGGLVEPYKEGLTTPVSKGGWGIKKFNLDDLYIRFFRIAERRIAKSGKGVVCYISNFSYLGDPSYVVMRQRLLGEFDKIWIDCMNGDSRETGKVTPEGKPDPSVFSTEKTPVGIRVGTAISLFVRKSPREKKALVRFQHYWGATKRQDVLASLKSKNLDRKYQSAKPATANRFSFRPSKVSSRYLSWPRITRFSALHPFNGPVERRGQSLIAIDKARLEFLKLYLSPRIVDDVVRHVQPAFMKSSGEFKADQTRNKLKGAMQFNPDKIALYPFKPFDVRWAYLDSDLQPLFSRPSPQLLKQRFPGNAFFMTRETADKTPEGPPFFFSNLVCDYDCISGHTRHFPIQIMNGDRLKKGQKQTFFGILDETIPADESAANLSKESREYLCALRLPDPDQDAPTAELIWMHALAIGYSPAYLEENADGIRQDWPRIPLPAGRKALLKSAELGRRIAALLDTDKSVEDVTCGKVLSRLKAMGSIQKTGGGSINIEAGELDLTAGWGHAGKDSVCMPGKGKIEIRKRMGGQRGEPRDSNVLGDDILDIYLNDAAYWSNVPQAVWDYTIGGYQVIKKWLSYREKDILGRGLTMEEADYVTAIIRRIAALILLQPELDKNYEAVKAETWPWPEE